MISGGHKTAILDRLIEEFKAIGYVVSEPPRVLNAAQFGVPQDRRRLFLLGSREDVHKPDYPWPTVEPRLKRSGSWPATTQISLGPIALGPTVWDALRDLPDADDYPELLTSDEVALVIDKVAEQTVRASSYARLLRGLEKDPSDYSHPRAWDPAVLTSSMRTTHTDVSTRRFAATEPGAIEPVSRFYRLTSDGLCNTIRAGTASDHGAFTAPRPIHPTLARVLTVREAARLHSFPDWFRLHRTKWHGFRQVGNAVPPLLGRAVGAQIIAALGISPSRSTVTWDLGPVHLLGLDVGEASEFFEAPRVQGAQRRRRGSKAEVA
jgi:DNA (cytosine-5)-methyltransferase 1